MIVYFPTFDPKVHFHKDVIQFPLSLSRHTGQSIDVLAMRASRSYPHINIVETRSFFQFIRHVAASRDKTVIMYFLSSKAKFRCIYLRAFSRSATIIVKSDQDEVRFNIQKHQVSQIPGIWRLHRRILNAIFFRSIDQICVETQSVYAQLNSIPEAFGKVFLLPNGSSSAPRISKKENMIVFVGRYEAPQKNFELFQRALQACSPALKGWRVEVVGGASRHSTIAGLNFRGSLDHDDVMQLLSKAKVFALSSLHEGSPIVFAEAKAAGCAILTTNVSAAQDYVPSRAHGEIADTSLDDYTKKLLSIIGRCESGDFDFEEIQKYYFENFDWYKTTMALSVKLDLKAAQNRDA